MNIPSLVARCAGVIALAAANLTVNVAHADVVTLAGNTIAGGSVVFNNINGDSVNVGGLAIAPTFSLAAATYIAELDFYQKGDVVATGQIGFKNLDTSETFLFDSLNSAIFQFDIPTYVHYAAVGRTFAAGNYQVINDAASTWAFNPRSGGFGFTGVYAAPAPVSLPGTLSLLAAGLVAMGAVRRRRSAVV